MLPPISFLYVRLVKQVAQGLSVEDGEEMARGLYCIRPHERFTTHILGSAWLCYAVMLAWYWLPLYWPAWVGEPAEMRRVYDYEIALADGLKVLNVWKVCTRNVGIVRGLARRDTSSEPEAADDPATPWLAIGAIAAISLLACWIDHSHVGVSAAAFAPFYLIAGGTGSADINAGSSIGAAQAAPATGGSWVNATNTYVAPSATPFATTIVGDYVSIYADGATVTTYVAQVTTVVSNVSVVLSATIKYGTAPTDGAANRSAVAGGSWNTEQVLAAGGLATTTVPQSTKINMKGNLTITASRTISMADATTTTLWFSCYNTTPGDLDADTTNSLTKPIWTLNSTFGLVASGNFQVWSGLSVVGSRTGPMWTLSGSVQTQVRCRIENTSANAGAIASTWSGTGVCAYSWMKCATTATTTGVCSLSGFTGTMLGVVAEGGGIAGFNLAAAAGMVLSNCVGLTNTGAGVLATTANAKVLYSTFYGATVDGIKWTGTPSGNGSLVIGCLFSGLNSSTATTNGINNASGTNTASVFRACNDYYNVTNPEVGMGDSFAFFPQTDSNPVVTSGTNMTPVAGSNALNHGFPGIFENQTYTSFLAAGAVQPTGAATMVSVTNVAMFQSRQSVGY